MALPLTRVARASRKTNSLDMLYVRALLAAFTKANASPMLFAFDMLLSSEATFNFRRCSPTRLRLDKRKNKGLSDHGYQCFATSYLCVLSNMRSEPNLSRSIAQPYLCSAHLH